MECAQLIHIMNTIAAECITHQELTVTIIVVEYAIIKNTILLYIGVFKSGSLIS